MRRGALEEGRRGWIRSIRETLPGAQCARDMKNRCRWESIVGRPQRMRDDPIVERHIGASTLVFMNLESARPLGANIQSVGVALGRKKDEVLRAALCDGLEVRRDPYVRRLPSNVRALPKSSIVSVEL